MSEIILKNLHVIDPARNIDEKGDLAYCDGVMVEPSELKNLQKFLVPTTPLVVWIDKDKFWSSGFDSQEVTSKIINSGIYTRMQKLYSYGLVDCYIFK